MGQKRDVLLSSQLHRPKLSAKCIQGLGREVWHLGIKEDCIIPQQYGGINTTCIWILFQDFLCFFGGGVFCWYSFAFSCAIFPVLSLLIFMLGVRWFHQRYSIIFQAGFHNELAWGQHGTDHLAQVWATMLESGGLTAKTFAAIGQQKWNKTLQMFTYRY